MRLLRCDKAGREQQRGHKGPGKVETYIKVKMTNKNNSIDEGWGGGGASDRRQNGDKKININKIKWTQQLMAAWIHFHLLPFGPPPPLGQAAQC